MLQGLKPAVKIRFASPTKRPFYLATYAVSAIFLAYPAALHAQDNSTLEDLIPDSAVENPEEWAAQGVLADSPDQQRDIVGAEVDSPSSLVTSPDSAVQVVLPTADQIADAEAPLDVAPLDPLPEMTVQWPDDVDLPGITPWSPEADIQFAQSELLQEPDFAGAQTIQVDDNVVLAFIPGPGGFPVEDEFVERFTSLSTLEEYGDSDGNLAQIAARAKSDSELLYELLRVYGYYDGQIIRSVTPGDADSENPAENVAIRFDIVPGQRYQIAAVDLGQLKTAPDAETLRAAFEVVPGDPVSKDAIVDERGDLDQALGETGYPFAEIDAPELLIDHARISGDLSMPVQPNGKYGFGDVVSSDPEFLSGKHLASIARFKPGDTYQRSLENDLRQAIIATGLVSSVAITPKEAVPPGIGSPGTVTMDVDIQRAPVRTMAGSIGYGSEEGFRVEASWENRNLFPPEGAFRVRGILGTREQLLGVTFRKNNFRGRDRVLTLDAYGSTLDSDAYDARTLAIIGNYEQHSTLLYQKPFSWSLGFEVVATDERPTPGGSTDQPRETYIIGALPVSVLYDTSDDLLDPTSGYRVGGSLSPEFSQSNSVWHNYTRGQIDMSYYKQTTDRVVAAGRFRLGSIVGAQLDDIAPSRRFYAGGGGSVRGYGYQQIGPRDIDGEPTGGRSAIELSAEARIQTRYFDDALSVVPFIDAGSVGRDSLPDFDQIKVGAGIGIRYETLIGPIRVDVGVPLNPGPDDDPVAVYVSLGQAF